MLALGRHRVLSCDVFEEILMSARGRQFADEWLADNITVPVVYQEKEDRAEAVEAARDLLAAAKERGISKEEIEEDVGDIEEYVADALNDLLDQ